MSSKGDCLSIQNRVDYYCFLHSSCDAVTLREMLQTPNSQDNAEMVHLRINHSISPMELPALLELMEQIGQLPLLRKFSISIYRARKLPTSVLTVLLKHAKNLVVLHLEDVCLQDSPYGLAEVLISHPTMHTIHMLRCYCSPVHVLLQALAKMPHLRHVTLDGSVLAQQRDADGLSALAALCRSKFLYRLELKEIEAQNMTNPLVVMLDALQQETNMATPPGLSELSLQTAIHETVPLVVVRALARMLLTNTSVHTIAIPWTGGGEVWLPIIEALAVNRTLKEFRLHPDPGANGNCLSHHFLQRAALILRDHNTQLNYFWYDSWQDIDLDIDLYIRANQVGRGHLVGDSNRPTQEEWVRALIASRDHIHVVNYWLFQNPSLLVSAAAKSAETRP